VSYKSEWNRVIRLWCFIALEAFFNAECKMHNAESRGTPVDKVRFFPPRWFEVEVIDMIFWIEKQFKNEYLDSADKIGVRCRFSINFDEQVKNEIKKFISYVRKNYYFPIRLNVVFFDEAYFVNDIDGHKYYGVFYDGYDNVYPKIHIAARLTERNPLEDILFSIAHEITHYYQWYFLENEKRTDRSLEIEANKWSDYILAEYYRA
jgi:hypothetical protein